MKKYSSTSHPLALSCPSPSPSTMSVDPIIDEVLKNFSAFEDFELPPLPGESSTVNFSVPPPPGEVPVQYLDEWFFSPADNELVFLDTILPPLLPLPLPPPPSLIPYPSNTLNPNQRSNNQHDMVLHRYENNVPGCDVWFSPDRNLGKKEEDNHRTERLVHNRADDVAAVSEDDLQVAVWSAEGYEEKDPVMANNEDLLLLNHNLTEQLQPIDDLRGTNDHNPMDLYSLVMGLRPDHHKYEQSLPPNPNQEHNFNYPTHPLDLVRTVFDYHSNGTKDENNPMRVAMASSEQDHNNMPNKEKNKKFRRPKSFFQNRENFTDITGPSGGKKKRWCSHCATNHTPQWRAGPQGQTLCNACGMQYKLGRLTTEYRPATSPSFDSEKHSNYHKKILKLKERKHPSP